MGGRTVLTAPAGTPAGMSVLATGSTRALLLPAAAGRSATLRLAKQTRIVCMSAFRIKSRHKIKKNFHKIRLLASRGYKHPKTLHERCLSLKVPPPARLRVPTRFYVGWQVVRKVPSTGCHAKTAKRAKTLHRQPRTRGRVLPAWSPAAREPARRLPTSNLSWAGPGCVTRRVVTHARRTRAPPSDAPKTREGRSASRSGLLLPGRLVKGAASTFVTAHALLILKDRREHDIAIPDAGMVALEINRPGPELIRPERPARAAEQRRVVDDLDAVEDNRHVPVA